MRLNKTFILEWTHPESSLPPGLATVRKMVPARPCLLARTELGPAGHPASGLPDSRA